jgi:hypothetical protein
MGSRNIGVHFMLRLAAGRILLLLGLAASAAFTTGCTIAPPVSVRKLALHRDTSDLSGLKTSQLFDALDVSWALPREWEALPLRKTPLYTQQPFRAPS